MKDVFVKNLFTHSFAIVCTTTCQLYGSVICVVILWTCLL